jgi:hypothetical protein
VINEARYLAVALDVEGGKREVKVIYPILESIQMRRRQIEIEKSGTDNYSNPDEIYWLFKLGNSLTLKNTFSLTAEQGFRLKLASREDLSSVIEWSQLPEKYSSLLQ